MAESAEREGKAAYFRRLANEAEAMARDSNKPEIKASFQRIAEQWLKLAADAERADLEG